MSKVLSTVRTVFLVILPLLAHGNMALFVYQMGEYPERVYPLLSGALFAFGVVASAVAFVLFYYKLDVTEVWKYWNILKHKSKIASMVSLVSDHKDFIDVEASHKHGKMVIEFDMVVSGDVSSNEWAKTVLQIYADNYVDSTICESQHILMKAKLWDDFAESGGEV